MASLTTEKKIISNIHNALNAAGYSLFKVNDGEETEEITELQKAIEIFDSVGDIVTFYYRRLNHKFEGSKEHGAVQYIAGNGEDVAHDWSGILDEIISPLIV